MCVDYSELGRTLSALMEDVPYQISNLSNASALLWQMLPEINWVGFYKRVGDKLILGPFQGKPACIGIPMGRGVCGTAARQCRTVRVANVHEFPGHIACDSASQSEIVVPIHQDGHVVGVLDIDSPALSRFDETDELYLVQLVRHIQNACRFDQTAYRI